MSRKVSAGGYRAREGLGRTITVRVSLQRRSGPTGAAPRRAMAAALEGLAKTLRKRSSAFRGA